MDIKAHDNAIRSRFEELLKRHSQADIARATQTSRTNIHYYLKGRRLPADFCAGLANELDVNPAWLLLGEGEPYLTDVRWSQTERAETLLELVQSMNAIARMRLGALAGKDHLKVFRKLNDALFAWRETRERLSADANPVLAQLLEQLQHAFDQYDVNAAKRLLAGALQISEFCDDEQLKVRLDRLHAHHEFTLGNLDRAAAIYRGLVLRLMTSRNYADPEILDHLHYLIDNLRGARLGYEAKRFANAALALFETMRNEPAYGRVALMSGLLSLELGDMREAQALVRQAFSVFDEESAGTYRPMLDVLDLYAGTLPFDSFCRQLPEHCDSVGARYRIVYSHVPLVWACWLEDKGALTLALKDFAPLARQQQMHLGPLFAAYAEGLLALLRSNKRTNPGVLLKEFDGQGLFDSRNADIDLLRPLLSAQLHRISGNFGASRRFIRDTQEVLDRAEGTRLYYIVMRMMHYRNVLRLAQSNPDKHELGDLVERSRSFFATHHGRGYGCLRGMTQPLPPKA
ncbi:MAG: helix-turn-helix transcriptional regulator [Planctomycetaceae bacterium]|nr:helix-turn-helix transcriptional regulator [Planctomycetaceae bacterium]